MATEQHELLIVINNPQVQHRLLLGIYSSNHRKDISKYPRPGKSRKV